MSQPRVRLPLVIAGLALAQCFGWGMTFNLPAITGAAMAEALRLPHPAIMAGPTAMLVVMALGALPLARLFRQWGARPVMTASVAVGALGLLIIAVAQDSFSYFAGWLLVGAGGAGMLTTAAQIGVAELAGTNAKQAISALLIFGGLSTTICWPLLSLLQSAFGWRMATIIGAILMVGIGAPIYWLLLARRHADAEPRQATAAPPRLDWTAFTLLAFTTAANGFVTWGFSLTIIVLLEARGVPYAAAVSIASFSGLIQLSARLLSFAGGRRWGGLATGLVAAVGLPISFGLLLILSGFPAAIAFIALYSLAGSTMAVARSTMPLDLFPPAAYARASSALALPLNLSFAAAPPVFAGILAGPGSETALWVAIGLSLSALVSLAYLAIRRRRPTSA